MKRRPLLQQEIDSSSSDDDDQFLLAASQILHEYVNKPKHGGSIPGHQVVRRKRELGHCRLYEDYFSDDPTYGPEFFRRRFVIQSTCFFI